MSSLSDIRSELIALHIIEGGVSVHSETISTFFDIDDTLVLGFISAVYSYTFAVGKEAIQSIDFENCKFLFKELFDNRLLVLITKGTLPKEKEKKLLNEIALKYEIKVEEIEDGDISLLEEEETILPLEVIADIKRRKRRNKLKNKERKRLSSSSVSTSPVIPKIKIEEYYFEIIGKEQCKPEAIPKIKQVLSNFFLGYSNLLFIVYVIKKTDNIVTIIFGRIEGDQLEEKLKPIFQIVQKKQENDEKNRGTIKEIEIDNTKLWLQINVFKDLEVTAFTTAKSRKDLIELFPHVRRIAKFLITIL